MSEEMYDAVLFYFPRHLAMCKLPGEARESDRAGRANKSGIMLRWVAEAELRHGLQTHHHSGALLCSRNLASRGTSKTPPPKTNFANK